MVLQWSQQTVVGPHRIAIYKSVKKHSATEQMSQTRAQLVKGFSNTSASADVITVDSSANVGINKTSPVKDLDVTGEIRASTGILFGTDTAAANTLDDYEEGTWTPVFFDILGGTLSCGYSQQSGNYTKVGNTVTCTAVIICSSVTGTASAVGVSGLPFANFSGARSSGSIGNNAAFSSLVPTDVITRTGLDSLQLRANDKAANSTNIGSGNLTASSRIDFTITYFVA